MLKSYKPISINILSVLIILISVFIFAVTGTNSWFTVRHENAIEIQVQVKNINLNVYQTAGGVDRKIYTYEDNKEEITPQYIELSGEIKPDELISLHLKLKNEDKGQTSMFVRYKFELYQRRYEGVDSLIPVEISGFTAPTTSTAGFTKDGDYYYYKESNVSATNALFAKDTEVNLLTSFTVPYSSFVNESGTRLNNSSTIYIKLIVEASSSGTFTA